MLLHKRAKVTGCWLLAVLAVLASSRDRVPGVRAQVPDSQIQALQEWYVSLNLGRIDGFGTGAKAWGAGTDPCNWFNVTCNDARTAVTGVEVRYGVASTSQISGDLPAAAAIEALPGLEFLIFYNCAFRGNLNLIGAALAGLANLTWISLSKNKIYGTLPLDFARMQQLKILSLNDNQLDGPIPEEWESLQNLFWLNLGGNRLTGTLPSWLRQPRPRLQYLVLEINQFVGVLDLAINAFAPNRTIFVKSNFFNATGTGWGQADFWTSGRLEGNCIFGQNLTNQKDQGECDSHYRLVYPPSPSSPRLTSVGLIAGAAAGGTAAIMVLALLLWCVCLRRLKKGTDEPEEQVVPWTSLPPSGNLTSAGAMIFSLKDVEKMTAHFSHLVGRGGFGPVYYGLMKDGRPLAVKRRDKESKQGIDEFVVEVEVLTKLARHNHLVNLVGFCCEKGEQILVYEYMPNGTLSDHMRRPSAAVVPASATGPEASVVSTAPEIVVYEFTSEGTTSENFKERSSASGSTALDANSCVSIATEAFPSPPASAVTLPDSERSVSTSASSKEGRRSNWRWYRGTESSPSVNTPAPSAVSLAPSQSDPGGVWGENLAPPAPVAPLSLVWRRRLKIALGAAKGVNYLHSEIPGNSVLIHRDLKPANILLDERMEARVADFGLAKLGQKLHDSLGDARTAAFSTNVKGTPGFVDPEYYQLQHLTTKSDVYSFGIILLMLISGRAVVDIEKLRAGAEDWSIHEWALPLIRAKRCSEILDPTLDEEEIVPESLEIVCNLALGCVQQRGRQRPTMQEVVHKLEQAFAVQRVLDKELHQEDENEEDEPLSPAKIMEGDSWDSTTTDWHNGQSTSPNYGGLPTTKEEDEQ